MVQQNCNVDIPMWAVITAVVLCILCAGAVIGDFLNMDNFNQVEGNTTNIIRNQEFKIKELQYNIQTAEYKYTRLMELYAEVQAKLKVQDDLIDYYQNREFMAECNCSNEKISFGAVGEN